MSDPTDSLWCSLRNAQNNLARCATFRTLVGAADEAAALTRIARHGINRPRTWAPVTAVTRMGSSVLLADRQLVARCKTPGTTGATEPTWPSAADTDVADGGAVWRTIPIEGSPYNSLVRALRPFAIVKMMTPFDTIRDGVYSYGTSGDTGIVIEADVPAAWQPTLDAAGDWFAAALGGIIEELKAVPEGEDVLTVDRVQVVAFDRGAREEEEDLGDFFWALLQLSWRGA